MPIYLCKNDITFATAPQVAGGGAKNGFLFKTGVEISAVMLYNDRVIYVFKLDAGSVCIHTDYAAYEVY